MRKRRALLTDSVIPGSELDSQPRLGMSIWELHAPEVPITELPDKAHVRSELAGNEIAGELHAHATDGEESEEQKVEEQEQEQELAEGSGLPAP